ncbi:oleosin H2-like [Impatiens glandulifera]|uniref:oleosin H2-like n=1 Tax=Impatiens glandulifera TaxID=253017 RepID=UPI001FB0E9AD|nr:oleosin H2-like [Impatiens glandulifera]
MAETRGTPEYDRQHRLTDPIKSILPTNEKGGSGGFGGVSGSKILAVVTLLPLGGFLLFLSGLILAGTLMAIAFSTPPFIIFSPVLVPAAFTIAFSIGGFLTSGAFGITALSALSWMLNYLRGSRVPEQLEYAKRRAQEAAGQVGQKVKEAGQKAQDTAVRG